jgi:hypothetical protein
VGINPVNISRDSSVDASEIRKSASIAEGSDANLNSVHVDGATTVTLLWILWIIKNIRNRKLENRNSESKDSLKRWIIYTWQVSLPGAEAHNILAATKLEYCEAQTVLGWIVTVAFNSTLEMLPPLDENH